MGPGARPPFYPAKQPFQGPLGKVVGCRKINDGTAPLLQWMNFTPGIQKYRHLTIQIFFEVLIFTGFSRKVVFDTKKGFWFGCQL